MGIFLPGGGQLLDVSANFLSGFRDPRLIQRSHQSVSIQNSVNHFIHGSDPEKYCIPIIAVHHFGFQVSRMLLAKSKTARLLRKPANADTASRCCSSAEPSKIEAALGL